MSPSLRTSPKDAILRRLLAHTMGLGYWAAVDALSHMGEIERKSILRSCVDAKVEVPHYSIECDAIRAGVR